jgi:hypothetical protein
MSKQKKSETPPATELPLTLPPWTQVALPHDDVRDEHAVRAEYAVNLGKIDRGDANVRKSYADPHDFFAATYMTQDLRRLLSDVMAALSGRKVDRVLQLRTPFGGGKSHSLVGLYHLARSRAESLAGCGLTDLADPGPVRVAVLPCADLNSAEGRRVPEGFKIRTLWGELAYRLGGADGYQAVRTSDEALAAPGGQAIEAMLRGPNGEATLILADEVLVYVASAMAIQARETTLGRQTMAFLQQLTEAVAGDPRAVLVYSLQASIAEAVGEEGLLQALDKLVGRVDARRVPVQDSEVREIIRRRLFQSLGSEAERARVADAYVASWKRYAASGGQTDTERERIETEARMLREDIITSYPLHPSLIRLMYERWGSLPSYQRTRGALQFLGAAVHVLFHRGHSGALISPGDIPLDDPDVRNEFYRQIGEREKWDSVIDADIATDRARAKRVDRRIGDMSPALLQARVGSTTATAIALYSFGVRKDDQRGVTQQELITSCLRPGVEAPSLEAALNELREMLLHLHATGGRYRLDTIPSLIKLVEEAESDVDGDAVTGKIRTLLSELFKPPTGILWPDSAARIPDDQRDFLLAYMPLEWAEHAPAQAESSARTLLQTRATGGKRHFKNGVGFVLPSRVQADQARTQARKSIALHSLRKKADAKKLPSISSEQIDELHDKQRMADKDLDTACRNLYVQVLLPMLDRHGDDPDSPVTFRTVELGGLAAQGDPHARVFELLKRQVFPDITVERLVEILSIGVQSPPFMPLSEAIEGFFRFVGWPKMRSEYVILEAIAKAVSEKRLGYVPSAQVVDGKFVVSPAISVRLGSHHTADEFNAEDGAYLLTPALAEQLIAERAPSGESPLPTVASTPQPAPATAGGDGKGGPSTSGSPPVLTPPPKPVAKGARGKRVALRLTMKGGPKTWYTVASALNQLAGKSDKLTLRVEVDAHSSAGFDPSHINLQVKEPLTESDGVEFEG